MSWRFHTIANDREVLFCAEDCLSLISFNGDLIYECVTLPNGNAAQTEKDIYADNVLSLNIQELNQARLDHQDRTISMPIAFSVDAEPPSEEEGGLCDQPLAPS